MSTEEIACVLDQIGAHPVIQRMKAYCAAHETAIRKLGSARTEVDCLQQLNALARVCQGMLDDELLGPLIGAETRASYEQFIKDTDAMNLSALDALVPASGLPS